MTKTVAKKAPVEKAATKKKVAATPVHGPHDPDARKALGLEKE